MRKYILIDFDRTIFDTDRFYEMIRSNIADRTTYENFYSLYSSYQSEYKVMNIFDMLSGALTEMEIERLRSISLYQAPLFVFSDARIFLEKLQKFNEDFIIFTYGNYEFQRFKIHAAGMNSYSSIITSQPKHTHSIISKAKIIIDDNPNFVEDVIGSGCEVVRMQRPDLKYSSVDTCIEVRHAISMHDFEVL